MFLLFIVEHKISFLLPDDDEAISDDGGLLVSGQHQPPADHQQQFLPRLQEAERDGLQRDGLVRHR